MTGGYVYLYGFGAFLVGLAVGFFHSRGTNWKILRERFIALAPMFFGLLVAGVFILGGRNLFGGADSLLIGVSAMAFSVGSLVGAMASR